MLDNFDWSYLIVVIPPLPFLVVAYVLPSSHKLPPYLGPWPWQLTASLASLAIILSHIHFPIATITLLYNAIDPDHTSTAPVFLSAAWLLAIVAPAYQYLKPLLTRRTPSISTKAAPTELLATAKSINTLLKSSPDYQHAQLSILQVDDYGPTVEVRRSGPDEFRILIRDAFKYVLRDGRKNPALLQSICRFLLIHEFAHYLNGDMKTASIADVALKAAASFFLSSVPLFLITLSYALVAEDSIIYWTFISIWASMTLIHGLSLSICNRFNGEREKRADRRAQYAMTENERQQLFAGTTPITDLLEGFAFISDSGRNPPNRRRTLETLVPWLFPRLISTGERVTNLRQQTGSHSIKEHIYQGVVFGTLLGLIYALSFLIFAQVRQAIGITSEFSGRLMELLAVLIATPMSAYLVMVSLPVSPHSPRSASLMSSKWAVLTIATVLAATVIVAMLISVGALLSSFRLEAPPVFPLFLPFLPFFAALIGAGCFIGAFMGTPFKDYGQRYAGATSPWYGPGTALCIAGSLSPAICGALISYLFEGSVTLRGFGLGVLLTVGLYGVLLVLYDVASVQVRTYLPIGFVRREPPLVAIRLLWQDFFIDWRWTARKCLTKALATIFGQILLCGLAGCVVAIMVQAFFGLSSFDALLYSTIGVALIVGVIGVVIGVFEDRLPNRVGFDSAVDPLDIAVGFSRIAQGATSNELVRCADRYMSRTAETLRSSETWSRILPTPENPETLQRLLRALQLARLAGFTPPSMVQRQIQCALRQTIAADCTVRRWPKGPADLGWTAVAGLVVSEAGVGCALQLERIAAAVRMLADTELRAKSSSVKEVRCVRNRDLFQAAGMIDAVGHQENARAIGVAILNNLGLADRSRCGLSVSEQVRCMLIARVAMTDVRTAIENAIARAIWHVTQTNSRLRLKTVLDCIEALQLMRRHFGHDSSQEIGLERLLVEAVSQEPSIQN